MKYFALIIILFPSFISACVVGPKILTASVENGFVYEVTSSELCENCNRINITAPLQYNNRKFSHVLYTLRNKNKIISRSIHSSIRESGVPEFSGIIVANENISYEITFEYGAGYCMAYQFVYKNKIATHNK